MTNYLGIEWMKRHLAAKGIRLHTLSFEDHNALHIDTTFNIIGPGLVISNPTRPCNEIEKIKKAGWRVVFAPPVIGNDNKIVVVLQFVIY